MARRDDKPIANTRPVTLLLIEDDEVDRMVVRKAFAKHRIANPIVEASDGAQALEILRGENGREPLQRPYIIILDLNLPRMNGFEFLAELRNDARIANTIVFVLTTSRDELDRAGAYAQHVAGYMVKADAGADFINAVSMLDRYWRVVELPT